MSSQSFESIHSFDFPTNEFTALESDAELSDVKNLDGFKQPEDFIDTQVHDAHERPIPGKKRKLEEVE